MKILFFDILKNSDFKAFAQSLTTNFKYYAT